MKIINNLYCMYSLYIHYMDLPSLYSLHEVTLSIFITWSFPLYIHYMKLPSLYSLHGVALSIFIT